MADWDNIESRGEVEDRRGSSGVRVGGGLGIGGVILLVALNYFSGGNLGDVLGQLGGQMMQQQASEQQAAPDSTYAVFASTVLGSANDLWKKQFGQMNKTYVEPRLVLFRDFTQSNCGGADSSMGPHYCPLDQTIYLDETFFDVLTGQLKAKGGDVAEAYVMAHEVGHHVQYQLGLLKKAKTGDESVQTELQADCLAGAWAKSVEERKVVEPGEISEAIDAAAAVGDDRVQKTYEGYINPETWTHGSSKQRVAAFERGFGTGELKTCL